MSDPTTGTPANAALTAFAPDLVFANPYQHHSARRFRGDEFDALVEDIRVNGIHQPPPARPHPDVAGAVQLQMGHRRLAAWRVARPGEPFTVIVKPITDLEMLEGVIEENIHRADLNDIERAQMIETYKQMRPDATNADILASPCPPVGTCRRSITPRSIVGTAGHLRATRRRNSPSAT